jgi:hypothetical protein
MANSVVVKQVPRRPFFDLFVGKGWRNWTRVHRSKQNETTVISGLKLDTDFIDAAIKDHLQERTNAVS